MLNKLIVYSFIFLSIFFTSCKKEAPGNNKDFKTLGTAAHSLLSFDQYSALLIEVNYMPGYAPDGAALSNLQTFLNTHLNKPAGIQITTKQIEASGKKSLSLIDLVRIENKYRTAYTGGNTIAVHLLITDAPYTDTSNLALSYWSTSACLFGKSIVSSSGGAGQVSATKVYTVLLQHEFGHLLGLVNQGSPMQVPHLDAGNGAHCNNANCLMYYGIETEEGIDVNKPVPMLDDSCIADLKANGGK